MTAMSPACASALIDIISCVKGLLCTGVVEQVGGMGCGREGNIALPEMIPTRRVIRARVYAVSLEHVCMLYH